MEVARFCQMVEPEIQLTPLMSLSPQFFHYCMVPSSLPLMACAITSLCKLVISS